MRFASRLLLAAVLFAALGNAEAAHYTLTQLQVGTGKNSYAFAVNNAGSVLGAADQAFGPTGFVWQSGVTRFLPVTDYGSLGLAINQSGQVAGYAYGAHGLNWTMV